MDSTDAQARVSAGRLLPVVVTGLYAWAVSGFPVAARVGWLSATGVFSGLAAAALLLALVLPSRALAFVASFQGFVSLQFIGWCCAPTSAFSEHAVWQGALAWGAYTIALGALSTPDRPRAVPGDEGGGRFPPRAPPSWSGPLVVLGTVVVGGVLFLRALEGIRPEMSILAQVTVLAVLLVGLGASARLAQLLQTRASRPLGAPRLAQLRSSGWLFAFLLLVLALGLASGWASR